MSSQVALEETHGPSDVREREVEEAGIKGPFFQQIAQRKNQRRDAKILVTADHGQTGVGKTSLAVFLALALDTSADGWSASKATLDVPEFLEMWDELEPGSAAILDEAEQLDARRSMTNENVDATHRMQTRRVNEIVAILTLPSPQEIDSRIERLADYWVNVEARGRARIYEKKIQRMKGNVYYQTLQTLSWPNMDKSRPYKELARMKREFIDDKSSDDNWVRKSTVDERVERVRKETAQEARNAWITSLKEFGLTGADIESLDCVDIKAPRINQIARTE